MGSNIKNFVASNILYQWRRGNLGLMDSWWLMLEHFAWTFLVYDFRLWIRWDFRFFFLLHHLAAFGPFQHISDLWFVLWQCGQCGYVFAYGLSAVFFFILSLLLFANPFLTIYFDIAWSFTLSLYQFVLFCNLRLVLRGCCRCCCHRGDRRFHVCLLST